MDDRNDVERLLDRYRPASPPASLRARVLGSAAGGSRGRALRRTIALAAGITALVLHLSASRIFADIARSRVEAAAAERQAAVEAMTAALGGGDLAREAATEWLREAEVQPEPPASTRLTDVEATWFQQ
jgi:hypothetical protein